MRIAALISNMEASRQTVTELEKALAALSERMLSGVATKYGRSSMEYSKAGGSKRKGGSRASQLTNPAVPVGAVAASEQILLNAPLNTLANGTTPLSNGKAQQPTFN